ncbi:multicopper oxidase family protein [Ornithinibacillus halophilus]|uniref:Multicopper oxidase with three cupredoxin domains (Includes cell division protein FtsP and spore coat protein CotA) n=1 Tax=Ornithinibacillus halophilus TaxID=930117 RepID=A0A1M5L254_9BACI|nr:multicopper oxidase domain-containing protein [Ornithinibacillus halophilus]SHG59071.1 Multicopper oxidase with three cupredoxin domains (includes cell division protein FtsP and spore coat protein CotA) [Ornithinibacillus halophilus]
MKSNVGELDFEQPLKIPELLEPTIESDGSKHFSLTMKPGTSEFLPGKTTDTWGVNGSYLGPTIRVSRGDEVSFDVENKLGEISTLHWHGMMLPPVMDGGPHQMIEANDTWSPYWEIDQPAATTWYHPHLHGKTAQHVYQGIAGMFIIDDEDSEKLPSNYGVDDIPLIVQDKLFTSDGQFTMNEDSAYGTLGDEILVNGTYDPYLEVTASQVRFRLLNGSNARAYNFGFTDGRSFQVVGNDAGLLNEPVTLERIMLSPGERAEIVVQFEPGDETILRSYSRGAGIANGNFDILKINAASELTESTPISGQLSTVEPIEVPEDATLREFTLTLKNEINDKLMDMQRIDEVVPAGAKEIWVIHNYGSEHNFHIHDAAFRVLDVDGNEPEEYERGRKDTVYVPHGATVRLAVEFGNHTDLNYPLMYHCHLLKHEDEGMMGQFLLVEPGTDSEVPMTLPESDMHH